MDAVNNNTRVKPCSGCGIMISNACKSCKSCGCKQIKQTSVYNPTTTRPRTKEQLKAYIDAGEPMGPHRKVTNVTTINTIVRRMKEHPTEYLIADFNAMTLTCGVCNRKLITSKQNVESHMATKKHKKNREKSKNRKTD